MKGIDFSRQELEFLRHQFKMEFEEAREYAENIRSILRRIGAGKTLADKTEPVEKEENEPVIKPGAEKSSIIPERDTGVKKHRTRSDKGRKRIKKSQKVIKVAAMSE